MKKPWRCRLFGHDPVNPRSGFPCPDLWFGAPPDKLWRGECRRCGIEMEIQFQTATGNRPWF
jgi:hypothetical protein